VAEFANHLLEHNAHGAAPQPGRVITGVTHLPDKVAVAALAGAYFWVVMDLLRRTSSLTLLPSDISYYALRMMIAPVVGYALGTVAGNANASVLVAFAITLLPFGDLMAWARSLSARALNVANNPEDAPDRLTNLPGVDSAVAERLQQQGITTILQLCDADPVQLSMRTGLDFAFMVRLVNEAIGWSYFGNKLRSLASYGWSGAADIAAAARFVKEDIVRLEDAALGYSGAKAALEVVDAKLKKLSAQDPKRPDLEAQRTRAKQKYDDAKERLDSAALPEFDNALIDAITKGDLKLDRSGVRNIVRRIDADTYAHFISRLMFEVKAPSVRGAQPANPLVDWFKKLFSVSRSDPDASKPAGGPAGS
jgi:hypothetical protein